MKIIDLSQPLFDGMEVYPGDPEVHIKQIHNLDKEGWRLRYLQFSTHIGTHADALYHMAENGETIDKVPIDKFIGKTVLVSATDKLPKRVGLAFRDEILGLDLFEKIKEVKPLFVVVGDKCDFELEMERKYLITNEPAFTAMVGLLTRSPAEMIIDSPLMRDYRVRSFESKGRDYRYFDTFEGSLEQGDLFAALASGPLERAGASASVRQREKDLVFIALKIRLWS